MEEIKNTNEPQAKLTYEQLENAANQFAQQNYALRQQLQELNYHNMFKRLDYLFKVLEYYGQFTGEFVTKCQEEIVTILTPVEEVEDEVKE